MVNEYSSEFELMRIAVFPSIQIKTYGICNIWIAGCIRFPPVVTTFPDLWQPACLKKWHKSSRCFWTLMIFELCWFLTWLSAGSVVKYPIHLEVLMKDLPHCVAHSLPSPIS